MFDSIIGCSLVKRCVTISQCVCRLPNNSFLPMAAIFKRPIIRSSIKKNSAEFDEKTLYAISSRIQKAWSYCGTCRFQSNYYLHQKEIIGRCQGKDLKNILNSQYYRIFKLKKTQTFIFDIFVRHVRRDFFDL